MISLDGRFMFLIRKNNIMTLTASALMVTLSLSCENNDKFKGQGKVEAGKDDLVSTCLDGQRASSGRFTSHGLADTQIRLETPLPS